MLQVSTTPLREALRRLQTEGLLRSAAHGDITVVPLSVEEFLALWEVRINLDPTAVALAAQRYMSRDRSQMLAAAEDASETSDDRGAVQRDREFHSAIYHACHNPVLIELLDVPWNRADRYRLLVPTASSASETVREHGELLRLVLDRQARSAARLMKSHLQESRRLVEQSLLSQ
jgi:DNA-binding GntR family transcriptional regulator